MWSDTLLIIPVFNEAENLQVLLPQLKIIYPDLPVLLVDDGSQDNTREVALKHQVPVVSHPFNLGYGVAIQTGYRFALENGYRYLIQIDADGQHEVEDIHLLGQAVMRGHCDLAIGSRFLHQGFYNNSWLRQVGIRFFCKVNQMMTHQVITDPTSGFQAMNQKVLRLFTQRDFPDDFPDADVVLMLHYYGIIVQEFPVRMYPSKGKSMHQGWLHPFYYVAKVFLSILVNFSLKDYFARLRLRDDKS